MNGLSGWTFPNATRRSAWVPGQRTGTYISTVTTWGATTAQILQLREFLEREHVTTVVMEATSDYWKPFFYLLEETLPVIRRSYRSGKHHQRGDTALLDVRHIAAELDLRDSRLQGGATREPANRMSPSRGLRRSAPSPKWKLTQRRHRDPVRHSP